MGRAHNLPLARLSTPLIVEIDVGCRVNACIALAAFVPR
jgi:hypothetical protein